MSADRIIVLDLVNDGDGRPAHARIEYRPGDPNYAEIVRHLGGISPGERKIVPPWPDR